MKTSLPPPFFVRNPQTTFPGFMVKSTCTSKSPFAFWSKNVKVNMPKELVIVWGGRPLSNGSFVSNLTQRGASSCPEMAADAASSACWLLFGKLTRVGPDRVACAREAIPPQSTPIINMYFNDFMLYLSWYLSWCLGWCTG